MLGYQLIWNNIPFGPIPGPNTFLPIESFNLSTAIKLEADEEAGIMKVTGREPQECCFSIRVQSVAGADPRKTYAALESLKGQSGGIYLANGKEGAADKALLDALQTSDWRKLFTAENAIKWAKELLLGANMGGVSFMLTAVNFDAEGITKRGEIHEALLTLSLTEDAKQSQTGGLRVFINGKDITESISVGACLYEMHAEGEADSLAITFTDTKNQWDKWKPSPEGDTVQITDGALDSGKMFLDAIKPENGKYKLTAYSTPKSAFSIQSRSFDGLSLPQLANKIAQENKLSVKLYDVPETRFKYAQQKGQNDLAFLQSMCKRAGVSFLIFDESLCLYGEKHIEKKEPAKTITLSANDKFTVTTDRHETYSKVELRNGTLTGTASDSNVKTGKIYRETVQAAWADQADANAEAEAKLRQLNKAGKRAELTMSTQRELAAGSVINLECTGWSGKAFIYRIRQDLLNKTSRIWVREPLTY